MSRPLQLPYSATGFTLSLLLILPVTAVAEGSENIEEITIVGMREDRKSQGATGLDLSVWETPQSLTIINSNTMETFGLTDINALLKLTTGVNVNSTETDRTSYNSRGFDITSMHIDGVGMPFGDLIVGDIDTAIYEKVEVIRGSNGLITGLGNPSGTINYVRKRPTNDFQGTAQLTGGTWNNKRADIDISTPLNQSGTWAARAVGVYQDKDNWLDHYSNQRETAYLVVDGQLTDSLTLATGVSHQVNNSDGVLWGAIPALYSDGSAINYDVATSTAMDWTYWNTKTDEFFAELGWQVADRWRLTTSARYSDYEEQSEIFYAYWNTGIDPETGLGLNSYPGKYADEAEREMLDVSLHGNFSAWGQEHELRVGASLAENDARGFSYAALTGFEVMPSFPGWRGNEVPRPTWATADLAVNKTETLDRLYSFLLLSLTAQFKLILGASTVDYNNDGISYGLSTDSTEDGSSPYIGFTWEVMDGVNAYGSYSDIYQPQYVLGPDRNPLGSAQGKSFELGLKKAFAGNTVFSFAIFRSEQTNLQEFLGYSDGDSVDDTDYSDDFDFSLYRGIDVDSEGFELEISGQVTDELTIQAGFTHLKLELANGDDARPFIPRQTWKMLLTWQPTVLPSLELGVSSRWQDDTYFDSMFGRINQDAYFLLGAYANYAVNNHLSFALNLDNIGDEEYFSSVQYDQVFYSAPRSANVAMNIKF